jgi:hypothetical protein
MTSIFTPTYPFSMLTAHCTAHSLLQPSKKESTTTRLARQKGRIFPTSRLFHHWRDRFPRTNYIPFSALCLFSVPSFLPCIHLFCRLSATSVPKSHACLVAYLPTCLPVYLFTLPGLFEGRKGRKRKVLETPFSTVASFEMFLLEGKKEGNAYRSCVCVCICICAWKNPFIYITNIENIIMKSYPVQSSAALCLFFFFFAKINTSNHLPLYQNIENIIMKSYPVPCSTTLCLFFFGLK